LTLQELLTLSCAIFERTSVGYNLQVVCKGFIALSDSLLFLYQNQVKKISNIKYQLFSLLYQRNSLHFERFIQFMLSV